MIDQSHNLKGKIEATVQTVVTAQELWLKAALIDARSWPLQEQCELSQPKSSSAAPSGMTSGHWQRRGARPADSQKILLQLSTRADTFSA